MVCWLADCNILCRSYVRKNRTILPVNQRHRIKPANIYQSPDIGLNNKCHNGLQKHTRLVIITTL